MKATGIQVIRRPTLDDPRILIALFLLMYDGYALWWRSFYRSPQQWAATVSVCVVLDFALCYYRRRKFLVPFSGLITAFGILLLCDSPFVWTYVFVAAASILSKHFITSDGKHIFNPSNFGLVLGMLFFSQYMVSDPTRWANSLKGLAVIGPLGLLLAYRANRLPLCAAWVGTYILCAPILGAISGAPMLLYVAPVTGAAFNLFTFYMITDPATSPSAPRDQVICGALIAIVDAVFRGFRFFEAPFFASFIVCGCWPTLSRTRAWVSGSLKAVSLDPAPSRP